jgi:CheY-like chemotaxis protein
LPEYNIAVVEDEGIIAMDIRKSLQQLGYGVSFVSDSGENALERLENAKTDLVLMDVFLKGKMNGIETAKIIIDDMKIPVVFLTAFEGESAQEEASVFKKCGYLVKPFEDSKLKTIIENSLNNRL